MIYIKDELWCVPNMVLFWSLITILQRGRDFRATLYIHAHASKTTGRCNIHKTNTYSLFTFYNLKTIVNNCIFICIVLFFSPDIQSTISYFVTDMEPISCSSSNPAVIVIGIVLVANVFLSVTISGYGPSIFTRVCHETKEPTTEFDVWQLWLVCCGKWEGTDFRI